MKTTCLTRSAIVLATSLCIGHASPIGATAPDPHPLRLTLSAGSLSLNGQVLALPGSVQQIVDVLGTPTRVSRLANTILTWDDLGIHVYVEPGSEQIKEIDVDFRKESFDFAPRNVFAGRLVIETTEVTAGSTMEQIATARKTLEGFVVDPHLDEEKRLACVSIAPRRRSASTSGSATGATADAPRPRPKMAEGTDPLNQLVGDWSMDGFLVGGSGAGFSRLAFGTITVAPAGDRSVSASASSQGGDDYSFRLAHDRETTAYLIAVKSNHGINVDHLLLRYVDGEGWRGTLDQIVDGEMLSTTTSVTPIEGRNWYGWRIEVRPTAAKDPGTEGARKPYLMADLTRPK